MNDYNQLLKDGYRFDMGEFMSDGWNLFSKGAGNLIGFVILTFLISIVVSFVPLINLLGNIVQTLLFAGVFVFCRQLTKGHQEFGDLFKGFNFAGPLILQMLILLVFMVPIFILFFAYLIPFDMFGDLIDAGPFEQQELIQEFAFQMSVTMIEGWWVMLLIMILGFYISLSYLFATPLVVDGGLGFWEAMELSRKVVGKKFFNFLIMFIVLIILMVIGITLTCGLGVLVAVPYLYCVIFAAYDKIFTPYLHSVETDIDSFGIGGNDGNTEREYDN